MVSDLSESRIGNAVSSHRDCLKLLQESLNLFPPCVDFSKTYSPFFKINPSPAPQPSLKIL